MNTISTSAAWLSGLLRAAAALTIGAVGFVPLAQAQSSTTLSLGQCQNGSTVTNFAWSGSSLALTCTATPPPVTLTNDPDAGTFTLSSTNAAIVAPTGLTATAPAPVTLYVVRQNGWIGAYDVNWSVGGTGSTASPSAGTVSFNDKDGAPRPITFATGGTTGTLTVALGAVTPKVSNGLTTTASGSTVIAVTGAPIGSGGDWKVDAASPQVACSTAGTYYDWFKTNGQKSQFTLKGGESAAVAFIAVGGTQPALSTTETINTPSFADNEIVVSQCPGDFTQAFPCHQSFTYTGGTLATNAGVSQPSYLVGAYCQLAVGNKYYMNVRQVVKATTTPSCPTSTVVGGCEIRAQVQGLLP